MGEIRVLDGGTGIRKGSGRGVIGWICWGLSGKCGVDLGKDEEVRFEELECRKWMVEVWE